MKKIALIGNPNTGKTSVFNLLTGQNRQVGNFAGVTVDKRLGEIDMGNNEKALLIDLPGTYSIFPKTEDEKVVFDILSNSENVNYPDLVVVVADSTNLSRSLLLMTQINDLGLPMMVLTNKSDLLNKQGLKLNYDKLNKVFIDTPILPINARLKSDKSIILDELLKSFNLKEPKLLFNSPFELLGKKEAIEEDTLKRLQFVEKTVKEVVEQRNVPSEKRFSNKIDQLLTHKVFGYVFLLLVLFGIFQMIFSFSELPMDYIDGWFAQLSYFTQQTLPEGILNELISEGIIPGIGGVVIFIPQIAILFFFISIMEETGYMSRVVFIMDRLMRPLGLSGKSVVPLMGSVACAIPGIMSARTISGWKNRMITILVAPFMSCSARIPVYTLLIALVIPDKAIGGIFNLKGLTLLGLYLLGTFAALGGAWLLSKVIKSKNRDFLIMEMPTYGLPNAKNTFRTVWDKTTDFVWGAGKIILTISILIWVLASRGPSELPKKEVIEIENKFESGVFSQEEKDNALASLELKNSYIGWIGKAIEPAITPLGYDWKIGIALTTSFAAREVFVGTLGTLYSVGETLEPTESLLDKMKKDINPITNKPTYNLASGMSLMIFYVFAMQCMATLAVVKKETKSWKWAINQLVIMGIIAYIGAFITYQTLS